MDRRSATMQNTFRRALFMLILFFLGLFLVSLYSRIEYQKHTTADARSAAVTVSRQAAGQIDAILAEIAQVANNLSADLSSGTIDKSNLVDRLKTEADKNSNIFGFVVAYRPYAFTPDRKLYAPYYHREDGAMVLTQVEDIYDYTTPAKHTMYYCAPMTQNSAQWIEPFWGEARRRLVVTYSAPFYANNDKTAPMGVVASVVSLNSLLYSRFENLTIVQYQDNFIPKLLYWPLITSLIFVITVLSFY